MKTIEDLAHECANEAFRAAGDTIPTDADGNSLLPTGPIGGDWDALQELLGREPDDDESKAFTVAYQAQLHRLVQAAELLALVRGVEP
jgi:hypothetical protein